MRKILSLLLITLLIVFTCEIYAYISYDVPASFYTAANTYDWIDDGNGNGHYDMNSPNDNPVDTSDPKITFLTHGLNGDASHWSNLLNYSDYDIPEPSKADQRSFSYTHDSLITKLSSISESQIYWAIKIAPNPLLGPYSGLNLVDISAQNNDMLNNHLSTVKYNRYNSVYNNKSITNLNKHIIIIFESENPNQTNDSVYSEFNYVASAIINQVKDLNGGKLPKINLIGHSRGGITNMQYALDHPKLVDSIFSLGTPYFGSTSASVLTLIDAVIETFGGPAQSLTHGMQPALNDIINGNLYINYANRWNNNFQLYNHIKLHAMGGYMSLIDLASIWSTNASKQGLLRLTENNQTIASTMEYVMPVIFGGIYALKIRYAYSQALLQAAVNTLLADVLSLQNNQFPLDDFFQILFSEINYSFMPPFVMWYNDFLVNLSSQKAQYGGTLLNVQGYQNAIEYDQQFDFINSNFEKASQAMPSVAHNLEARDNRMINYILKNITLSESKPDYVTYELPDNKIGISGYIGENNGSVLEIPSNIGGKTVIEIGTNSFSNNLNDNTNITQVNIPSTIKYIGKSAFSDNQFVNYYNIQNNSQLTEIGDGAFYNNEALNNINLPLGINTIGDQVFYGNTNLEFINLHNINSLGNDVFVGSHVSSIGIQAGNRYKFENKLLIDTQYSGGSRIMYGAYNLSNATIPSNTRFISDYAFSSKPNLTSINLSNQEIYIGNYAFTGSENLVTITNSSNTIYANASAFYQTAWYNNHNFVSNPMLRLGKVLLSYEQGSSTFEVPNDIYRIGENAFNSTALEHVVFTGTVNNIGKQAFYGASNLQSLLFTQNTPPILEENVFRFNSDVSLYVKERYQNAYANSTNFSDYANQIETKYINVRFHTELNTLYETRSIVYGSYFTNYPNIEKQFHELVGWYEKNNIQNEYLNGLPFDVYKDTVELKPIYEQLYVVKLLYNQNQELPEEDPDNLYDTIDVLENQPSIFFGVPERSGYDFVGWYDSKYGGNQYSGSDGYSLESWGTLGTPTYLYARWSAKEFSITYNTNGGTLPSNAKYSYKYGTLYTLPIPTRYGYVFDKWVITGTSNSIIYAYQNNSDIDVTAVWIGQNIPINSSTNTSSINYSNSVILIDISSISTSKQMIFNIPSNVTQITFIGNASKTYTNLNIVVDGAGTMLTVQMSELKFIAPNGSDGILVNNQRQLILVLNGENQISGGNGISGSIDGKSAIKGDHVRIKSGSLTVYGGNGYTGTNGTSGVNGGAGGKGGDAIYASAFIVDASNFTATGGNGAKGGNGGAGTNGNSGQSSGNNGTKGSNGGHGGVGGAGGYAIYVTSTLSFINSATYSLKGGLGGNGGNGAKGGNGGAGYSVPEWGNMFESAGNGGNGGNGGNAGNGGIGQFATNKSGYGNSSAYRATGGSAGTVGAGGTKGSGGIHWYIWGTNGSDGSNGSAGTTGTNGTSGSNQTFTGTAAPPSGGGGDGGGGGPIMIIPNSIEPDIHTNETHEASE